MGIGIITLVATLVVSLLVTRIGAVALTLTGMSQDSARFQARSAYTGVGFTTSESEQVVNHPVRRRVLAFLMLTGNVGIAVVIASMMATFAQSGKEDTWTRVFILVGCLLVIWVVGTLKWVDQQIEKLIEWALKTWTTIDVRDYVSLLHLADGYVVFELKVNETDWIAEKTLAEAKLSAEGVLVLGIHRSNGKYIGSPNGTTTVCVGDILSVYGTVQRLEELDIRKKGYEGDRAHKIAIEEQKQTAEEVAKMNSEEAASR
ncbi:MAG: TrkA C-terminal domain-containing protein [Mariniblastus sp.]